MKDFFRKIISDTTKISYNLASQKTNDINLSKFGAEKSQILKSNCFSKKGIHKINSAVISNPNEAENLRYLIDSSTTQSDMFSSVIRIGKNVPDKLFPDSEKDK